MPRCWPRAGGHERPTRVVNDVLRGNKTLRLTRREWSRWVKITGFEPAAVRSEADLKQFAMCCKRRFWGTSEDTRFLHFLIDEELRRNLAQEPIEVESVPWPDEAREGAMGVRSRC